MRVRGVKGAAAVGAVAAALLVGVVAGTATGTQVDRAAPPGPALDREGLARSLLQERRDRFATPAVGRALRVLSGEEQSPGRLLTGETEAGRHVAAGASPARLPRAGVPNVPVNDPGLDTHMVDQTTQSETTVAVSGDHVAVGFNDSQQALPLFTDGLDLSGYGWSDDGGRTFHDGGTLPNRPAFANVGDPWMTTDRDGRMYYATLAFGGNVGNLEIGVSRSGDGGASWTVPTLASPNDDSLFYLGDKEAITAGRAPGDATRDNLYVAWDDFVASESGAFNGLPVARSRDHGRTWSLHYADKISQSDNGCSFAQYIGAQPLVVPRDGRLIVVAERIGVRDPSCDGGTPTFSQRIFSSRDGGTTFGPGRTIATVTPATPTGALELGPGQLVRTVEFPSLAMRGSTVWAAWNDGARGRSHVRLARSGNGGRTWTTSWATSGTGDEIQPSLSVDQHGLHLAYYRRNADDTLDTVLADSTDDGVHFTARSVTTRSFPGVQTVPQFDPQIALGYMGDYIANVSAAGHQYLAWGDNRRVVTDFTHPRGRHDPDVFFARR